MNVAYREMKLVGCLLCVQTFCGLMLLLADFIEPALVQVSYCAVVFLSPPLLFGYGSLYLWEKRSLFPFCVEFALAVLFVGSAMYGIWSPELNGTLFGRLLVVYVLDVILCVVGFLSFLKS